MFILQEPRKCCSNKHTHIFSVTKVFSLSLLICWLRFLQAPPGQPGVGREVSPLEVHRPMWNLFVCPCGIQACPGHLSSDTSLTEVRLPVADIMTGQKATVTLPQQGFLRPETL